MVSTKAKLYEARKNLRKDYDKGKISEKEFREERNRLTNALEAEKAESMRRYEQERLVQSQESLERLPPTGSGIGTGVSPALSSSGIATSSSELNYTPAYYTPATQPDRNIVTPARTINTYRDADRRVIGIEDTQAAESRAAPKGEYYTEESVAAVERERADIIRKEARLQQAAVTLEARQQALYNQNFNEKGQLKQNLGERALSLLGVESLSKKRIEDYEKSSKALENKYYDETFSIYTGRDRPEPVKVDIKALTGRNTLSMTNPDAIKRSEVKSLSDWADANKQLRDSGYYALKNRQQMQVTSVPLTAGERKVLSAGDKLTKAQQDYINRKAVGTAGKVALIAVGGTVVSKGLEATGLAAKPLVQGIGKGLGYAYAGSVGARTFYDVYKPAKEGRYADAGESAFDLSTELAGVRMMELGSRTTSEFKRPIVQKEGAGYRFERQGVLDKNKLGGFFKRDIVTKGFVKDTGEIAYTNQVFRKGKLISEVQGSLYPSKTGYKGFEGIAGKPKPIEYRETDFRYQRGVEQPFLDEGAQRLAQVRRGLDLSEPKKFIEFVQVKGTRVEKGDLLNRQTSYQREYVSLVGETGGLSAPLRTEESTLVGQTRLRFKGSNLQRSLNVAVRSPLIMATGLQGQSAFFKLEPSVSVSKATGAEAYLIEPLFSPVTPRPFTLSRSRTELKRESLSSEMSAARKRLISRQLPIEEERISTRQESIQRPSDRVTVRLLPQEPQENQEFKPQPIEEIIQKPIEELKPEQIITPKEEVIAKPRPKDPDKLVPAPSPPLVLLPPVARFGLMPSTTRPSTFRGFKRPTQYAPSLLGIAIGKEATRTGNLSGLEIRGIPGGYKPEPKKSLSFGSVALKPMKDGISMKFKVERPKKKKKGTIGQDMMKRMKVKF